MNVPQSGLAEWKIQPQGAIQAIDTHAHIFASHLPMMPNRRYTPAYDACLDNYVTALKNNGISHAVLIQPSFLGTDNSHMLEAILTFSERLRGIIVIDQPTSVDEINIKTLQQMMEKGVVGIRLNLIGNPIPNLAESGWKKLLNAIKMFNWHVELHIEPLRLMPILNQLLREKVNIVIDHYARLSNRTETERKIINQLLKTADSGKVWIKLSASYRIAEKNNALEICGNLANTFIKVFSSDRLLWGSDWPHTQYENTGSLGHEKILLDSIVSKETDRRKILTATPSQLYGWSMSGHRLS